MSYQPRRVRSHPTPPASAPERHGGRIVFTAILMWLILLGGMGVTQAVWAYWGMGLDTSTVSDRLEKASKKTMTEGKTDTIAPLTTTGTPPTERWDAGQNELLGYLRVPAWGESYRLPIIQGTDETTLDMMGAGHFPDTAWAGEPGNASFAGHATYTDLAGIHDLKVGDQIIVEGFTHWWVYEVNADPYITSESNTGVVGPNAAGDPHGLSLTSCWPVLVSTHTPDRQIVHAGLVGWADKSQGVPEQLAEDTRHPVTSIRRTVENVSKSIDLPVTGVAGLSLLICWALLAAVGWMFSHNRMLDREWRKGPVFDPLSWLWRLTPGVWQSNDIVFTLTRSLLYTLLMVALVFLAFRWACPWIADTFMPDTPHPGNL